MKAIYSLFLILFIAACDKPSKNESEAILITDNEELIDLYTEDQSDRTSGEIDWSVVSERDYQRQTRVLELLDSNKVRTASDFENAAMIFQHGSDTIASGLAVELMKKAVAMDSTRDKWLLAAAIDRDLMRRGKPQIYGTQYVKQQESDPWALYELDSTQITDEIRLEYGVQTLAQQKLRVIEMNKKQQ